MIIGPEERAAGAATVRDLAAGTEQRVALADLATVLSAATGSS
ncbi:MAG: hypothetical protein ACREMV_15005 [Gemmatimonadales bacterium]